ncbi:hypothetical protein ACIA49_18635 [Kribbella sp. NPDC051587]|uniref:hypothetical protein n=1 Tax=Kribbella sp. NPDC051587 TaxID=3364119 RepID=UPI0037B0B790
MRKVAKTAAGIAVAALGISVLLVPAATAATEAVTATCPSGAFCIQEQNGTILSKNIWYSYGAHNLSGVTGLKYPVNNQTGGAGVAACFDYGGGRCSAVTRQTGRLPLYDFTPINSVVLVR